MRPGRLGFAAAALFLLTPRSLFILEQGWTEPSVVLGLAAVMWSVYRRPRVLPYLLGVFLVSKQYLVMVVPLLWLLLPGPLPRGKALAQWLGKVVATALLISLPMAVWDIGAFIHDMVMFQIRQPFRADSLSFPAWWVAGGGARLPTVLAFGVAIAGSVVALLRLERIPASFAVGIAATMLCFFAFNKQAFCNYYYFVLGTACIAAATQSWPVTPFPFLKSRRP